MQNKKFYLSRKIFCLSILLVAGSLLFAAKVPEWVTNPAKVYPRETYLYYIGEGADRGKAEVNAVNGLAAVFGQSVASATASSKRMIQAKADGKVATASVSGFSQDVLRTVDSGNLIGVEIKEFYNDGKTWYAAAVLDKSKATGIYREMIIKNAKAIKTLLEKSESDTNSIEGYCSYDFAADIAADNESYYQKLSVINSDEAESLKVNVPSSREISARKLEIAKNIPIAVLISGDKDGKLAADFREIISSEGFRTSLTADVRYVLTGTASFEESKTTDGKTTRCRYSLESYILDSETNHQFAPFTASGRESHVSYEEAENRAMKSLEKKVKTDFKKSFSDYLKNFIAQ